MKKLIVLSFFVKIGSSSHKKSQSITHLFNYIKPEVVGMVAIFTYEFPVAAQAFKKAGIKLITISNYSAMIQAAVKTNYVKATDVEALEQWREDPANWTPAKRPID